MEINRLFPAFVCVSCFASYSASGTVAYAQIKEANRSNGSPVSRSQVQSQARTQTETETRSTAGNATGKALTKLTDQEIVAIISAFFNPDNKEKLHIENFIEELNKNPNDFRLHFLLARAYNAIGMDSLADDEDKIAELAGQKYVAFVRKAYDGKVIAGEFLGATAFEPFVEKYSPNDPYLSLVKSIKLRRAGKISEAEAVLRSTLKRAKQSPADARTGLLTSMAALRMEQKQYALAVELFDQELAVNPSYSPALLGKIKALELSGNWGAALRVAIPLYLQNHTQTGLAATVANCLCHTGQYEHAIDPALVSLAMARQEEEMLAAKRRIQLIWSHVPLEHRGKSVMDVSNVFDKTIWGARFHFALGDALQKAGYIEESELQYRLGLRLDPQHASAYLHLAEINKDHYHNPNAAILNYIRYNTLVGGDRKIGTLLRRMSERTLVKHDLARIIKSRYSKRKSPLVQS